MKTKLVFLRVVQNEVEFEFDSAKLDRFRLLDATRDKLTPEQVQERDGLWQELYEAGYSAMFTNRGNERRDAEITRDPVASQIWPVTDGLQESEPLIDLDH